MAQDLGAILYISHGKGSFRKQFALLPVLYCTLSEHSIPSAQIPAPTFAVMVSFDSVVATS